MSEPRYEVYAVKYAHHERRASENFLGGDPHDGPMPLDYFVWLVRGEGGTFGLGGHRKLQDVLVDRKVPVPTRETCPVIEVDGEVFWVPGVVRSGHALVTANTRSVVRLTAQKPGIAGQ